MTYEDDDGLERGDEPQPYPDQRLLPKICEGRLMPHVHKDDAREYQYIDRDGIKDCKANLCSRCVEHDRRKGYILERTFIEEL